MLGDARPRSSSSTRATRRSATHPGFAAAADGPGRPAAAHRAAATSAAPAASPARMYEAVDATATRLTSSCSTTTSQLEPESILRALRLRRLRQDADARRRPHVRPAGPLGAAHHRRGRRPVHASSGAPRRTPSTRTTSPTESLRQTPWLHRRVDVDYNGWWMCLIPRAVVRADRAAAAAVHQVGRRRVRAARRRRRLSRRSPCPARPSGTCPGPTRTTPSTGRPTSTPATGSSRRRCTRRTSAAATLLREHLQVRPASSCSAAVLDRRAAPPWPTRTSWPARAAVPAAADGAAHVRAHQGDYPDGRVVGVLRRPAAAVDGRGQGRAVHEAADDAADHRPHPAGRPGAQRPVAQAGGRRAGRSCNIAAQDARWFLLARLDSATVGTADGRGVTFRRREQDTFWRMLRHSAAHARPALPRVPQARRVATAPTSASSPRRRAGRRPSPGSPTAR